MIISQYEKVTISNVLREIQYNNFIPVISELKEDYSSIINAEDFQRTIELTKQMHCLDNTIVVERMRKTLGEIYLYSKPTLAIQLLK